MKRTHREDVRGWSRFDEARDMDFHSWAWVREGGAVVIDPLPPSEHDFAQLGEVAWIVVTNSDHARGAVELAARTGARLVGPSAERDVLDLGADARWVSDGDAIVEGLDVLELDGSKTPGELALVLEGRTLITGDLVRAPIGGALAMLPDAKLTDRAAAVASVRRLAELDVDAVLVGDGWPVFRDGVARLRELAARL